MWICPSDDLLRQPDALHIWRAALDVGPEQRARLWHALEADERRRAERLRFEVLRQRFIAAHGMLRDVLSRYMAVPPESVRFAVRPGGKPELASGESASWRFNLSHSGAMALVAVAWRREVGVDIEQLRPMKGPLDIAARFFAPGEVAALRAMPPEQIDAAFFRCWTRKEAYVKALGKGLSLGLEKFEVTLDPHEPAALRHVVDMPDEPRRWWMEHLEPGPDYLGACVCQGRPARLHLWDWRLDLGETG